MIKHYDLTESDVSAKPYEAEALYYCTDSKNIYFDSPTEGERIKMSSDTIILNTEAERKSMLAPIADKIYIVLNSACMYIYSGGKWLALNQTEFEISNVQVSAGSAIVNDSRILAGHTAKFIPDPSIADLITSNSVTCAAGKATVTIRPTTYKFFGRLLVGGGVTNLIGFTIAGISYQAEEGMTWEAWINSEYNTNGCYIDGSTVYTTNSITPIVKLNGNTVFKDDIIISGAEYTEEQTGGSND